jgi:homoserine kinase type II
MAVYTALDEGELARWLAAHGVGSLVEWHGISSGIENSNFFVTTKDRTGERRFVLTLFERLAADDLTFYLALMQHLAHHDVPCPAPTPDGDGALFAMLAGKPAALVTRLPGHAVLAPTSYHCAAIGEALATMHEAGRSFALHQANPRGIDWWEAAALRVREFLTATQRTLLDEEMTIVSSQWRTTVARLPRGPIHGDLFRDNALFVEASAYGARLGGLIDFYFAGCDAWIFDLAVCANDWCVELASGAFDAARLRALLDAYRRVRPLTAEEDDAWPMVLRAAALRFWLSRLDDLHRPRPAQLLTPHDPAHFERILRQRRSETLSH